MTSTTVAVFPSSQSAASLLRTANRLLYSSVPTSAIMLAILFPTRCSSLNFPLWVFVFVAVVGVSMHLIGVAIVLSRAAGVSAIFSMVFL